MRQKVKKSDIAILLNSFWNSGAGVSGGDIRLIQILKRIKDKFKRVDVYCSEDAKKVVEEYEKRGINFILSGKYFDNKGVLKAYSRRASWAKREIIKDKYDIVYASSDFFTDVVPCNNYKKKNPKTKWVQCIFHVYPNWYRRPGSKLRNLAGTLAQKRSFRMIKKSADAVVVLNTQVSDYLIKIGFGKKKVFLNPCGVDLAFFDSIKAQKRENQAVFLARLMPSKGINDFAKIWKYVIRAIPSAKLKVIGGGSEEVINDLKAQFKSFKVEKNIELLGFLDNEEAFKTVKESQLFLFPSYEEGFGMAIAEAFACGLPAVAWNLPVYKEVFPKGIYVADVGDCEQFAQLVIDLLKNEKKRSLASTEARATAEKYGWDGIAQREISIIEQ